MLFRQRVSFQGALNICRRGYREMAAYNAPANAYHRSSSSLHQSNLIDSSLSPSAENHAAQSTSPAFSPPGDCRWKRGQPVTFSSRAFSTTPAHMISQAEHAAVGPEIPGVQTQVHSRQELGSSLPQSHQHSTGCGSAVVAMHHDTSAERLTCVPEHDSSTSIHADRAITNTMSEEDHTAETFKSLSADALGASSGRNGLDAPDPHAHAQPSSTGDTTMDEDYSPSSTDQSSNQQEDATSEADEVSEGASETHTPLEFQIPEDLLRAAMNAPDNTKASFWSNNLYRGPEDKRIAVHYCKTKEVAERVAQHFANEEVVGFDIEWKPWAAASSIKKNVSLIQLACEDRIALFHVALFKGKTAAQLMPPTLKAILESPDVYKVGVAIKGDFSRIIKFLEVEPQGVFELSRLHNLVQFSTTEPSKVTNKLVGLAAQVRQHLQLPLYKGGHLTDDPEDLSNVRSSDWSLPLNLQQIHYAAADAYAGFRLYDAMEEKRKQLKPTPPRPLVCDYDSKPKPKTSKPQKKRKTAPKTDTATAVTEEAAARKEREEADEQAEEEPKDIQETEGYETAQEELIGSHELEGEEPESSQERYEEPSEREDDLSTDPLPRANEENVAGGTDPGQKRVGRIDLSRLKGPDPEYPILPDLRGGEGAHMLSSDEDVVALDTSEDELKASTNIAKVPEDRDTDSDEFEDSELEEALMELDTDGDGKLREDTGSPKPNMASTQPGHAHEPGPRAEQSQTSQEPHVEPVTADEEPKTRKHSSPATQRPTSDAAQEPTHTPEYNLATSWAQSYLSSTVPSPTALTASHIRATVPHLRAYSMWQHQGLSLSEIARHLRDPPLLESTVGSYVLQAIVLERMEYDGEEVRRVLMDMPEVLRKGKWKGLADKVGAR